MKIYEVLDEKGVLKFTIPEHMAFTVFANSEGERKDAILEKSGKVSCFTLHKNAEFTISYNSTQVLKLCLWKGDRINTIEKD